MEGWGTWEEIILGGAVLRHGTADWNTVASEITIRSPTAFTPQACKERFQELQKRYCGSSTAWFDELRKRRVAELKQQLAKSENSIHSLESKMKYLEVEKQHSTESRLPPALATECMSKQTSNDAAKYSVGSFTRKRKDKFPEMGYGGCVVIRKKRSQRKRKEPAGVKETSDVLSTALPKGTSTTITHSTHNLIEIFKSISQSEAASVFKHRMDSQKRARYTRVIKQHMDIGTIRSRLMLSSPKQLFRDLLLLANNALVFYSTTTREYKSALSLRVLVMKEYKGYYCTSHEATSPFIPCNPPVVKPRTAPPRPDNSSLLPAHTSKQCITIHNHTNKSNKINVISKGFKRPGGKVHVKPVDPPPKQRKRLRR